MSDGGAYGKRLEGLSIPQDYQQSADRRPDEGAAWSWMTKCAVCVRQRFL